MSDQTAPAPGGLSDQEFERFAALSSKKTLSDAEMEEVSGLDTRLHGAATSGSQRQPAAGSGTQAQPDQPDWSDPNWQPGGKLQPGETRDPVTGFRRAPGKGTVSHGPEDPNDSAGMRIVLAQDSAFGDARQALDRLGNGMANHELGPTISDVLTVAGSPFAGVGQGMKEWLGDPLREKPEGKNGRMSARQVVASTLRAPIDLPAGGGQEIAHLPGVRQLADATLGSSQPGGPSGSETLGGALGAFLGAEVFAGRAPGSTAFGALERVPFARRAFDAAESRLSAPSARETWQSRQAALQPRSLADVAAAEERLRAQPSPPPNAAPGEARLASAMSPEQRQLPYSPSTGAPGVMLPPAGPPRPGAPVEGLFPSVDAELAARARSETPPATFREAQEARRSGQALAPERMPVEPDPVELALARASGTPVDALPRTRAPIASRPSPFGHDRSMPGARVRVRPADPLATVRAAEPAPSPAAPVEAPPIPAANETRLEAAQRHQSRFNELVDTPSWEEALLREGFSKISPQYGETTDAYRPDDLLVHRTTVGKGGSAPVFSEIVRDGWKAPNGDVIQPARVNIHMGDDLPPQKAPSPRFGRRGESGQALAPTLDDLGNRVGNSAFGQWRIPEAEPGSLRAAVERTTNEKIGNLKSYSTELFHKAKDVLSTAARSTAPDLMELDAILKRMKPEEIQEIGTEMGERRAPARTPGQKALIDWWHKKHPQIKQALNESGSRVVEIRKTADLPETIPADWNLRETKPGEYLVTRPIGTIEDFSPMRMSAEAREVLKAGGEEADMLRDRIYEETRKKNPRITREDVNEQLATYQRPSLKRLNPGVERPRKVTLPDDLREQDFVGTIRSYITNARKTVAEQRAFRFFDEKTGEPRNLDAAFSPQGDLGNIIGNLEPAQKAAAEKLTLDVLGRDPESWDPAHQNSIKRSNTVGAVNALRLYGIRPTTALVQLTQNAMTASFAGARATAKAVARVTTDWRTSYQEALRAGAVDAPSHYAETIGLREGETAPSGKARILQKATNVATTPMATTDLASRLVAWETRFDVATKLEQQLNGNAWRQGVAKTNLAALDYSPADIQKFKSGLLSAEDMDILGQRIVERTQGKVTNASRIDFATHPLGRLALQGKNFGIAQTRNTWRLVGKQLIEAKNPVPAARLLVSTYLVGKGLMAAKDFALGENKNRPDDWATALKEGGGLGMVGDIAHAAYEHGDAGWRQSIDNLTNAQWAGLVEEMGSLGINLAVPKGKRRSQVFVEALKKAAPTMKEWDTIYERATK